MKTVKLAIALVFVMSTQACDLVTENGEKISIGKVEKAERDKTRGAGAVLAQNQPTPTDISHSIERHNLIKRAYWVNGMRQKAMSLPNPVANMPLGHVVLLSNSGAVVGKFLVDGKVTSLNSYLSPDSEYYSCDGGNHGCAVHWMPDVDGAFGSNDNGIFFFTPDGKYVETTLQYLFTDIPVHVANPVVNFKQEQ